MVREQLEDIEYEPHPDDEKEPPVGHMLATMNPEAAAAIDNPPPPPDVGTWVVFKGRAGFSRMHRTEFPALVLGAQPEDGTLVLMVVMEPEDMIMESRVPFQSHNQEHFCWRYRRIGEGEAGASELGARIKAIEDFLRGEDALGATVEAIGKRLESVESVLASDEIEQLEERTKTLEANWKLLQPLLKAQKGK